MSHTPVTPTAAAGDCVTCGQWEPIECDGQCAECADQARIYAKIDQDSMERARAGEPNCVRSLAVR